MKVLQAFAAALAKAWALRSGRVLRAPASGLLTSQRTLHSL